MIPREKRLKQRKLNATQYPGSNILTGESDRDRSDPPEPHEGVNDPPRSYLKRRAQVLRDEHGRDDV
eukprot:CAMPEP_0171322854 /NCGR_PEP_ID=MMETSP0816-20121228/115215_1 /TAXON_ID=420281 /ORGANISM="Proboscia inermis, Strain CCAP1064/1" /LENGTH=66 /DNA_ID=CAMNT_0011821429 /DNA_START=1964 /DNA_END=2164 /DNA_ORIENTATION=-